MVKLIYFTQPIYLKSNILCWWSLLRFDLWFWSWGYVKHLCQQMGLSSAVSLFHISCLLMLRFCRRRPAKVSDEEHPASRHSDLVLMTDVSSEEASCDFPFRQKKYIYIKIYIGLHIHLTSKEGNDRPWTSQTDRYEVPSCKYAKDIAG